jgi:hypothetical protein
MNTSKLKYYKGLFLFTAVYDMIFGIVFTFFPKWPYELMGISQKLPEYLAYLSLIGAFLFVIGVAYFLIYRGDLQKNIDLILVGVLYKLAYFSITFFYFAIDDIPHILFFVVFGVFDFVMFILMTECYISIRKQSRGLSK